MQESTQQQSPKVEDNSPNQSPQPEDEGYTTLNRTETITNDTGEDPFDLSTPETVDEPATTPEPESEAAQTETEQKPEDESKPAYTEEFATGLDALLTEKAGVPLTGVVEALVELLTWRNDILQLEVENSKKTEAPTPTPKIPTFNRSQGRVPSPAANSYDFRHSEILGMSENEYEKNAQAITNAFRAGRVLMDTRKK